MRKIFNTLPSVPGDVDKRRAFLRNELKKAKPEIESLGYTLVDYQPHISGERVLMSGKKLVLEALDNNRNKVIIKCSRYPEAVQEIKQEQKIHSFISNLSEWGANIRIPKEITLTAVDEFTVFVTEYIPQEKTLFDLPLREQFFLITSAIEGQETAQLTTYKHEKKAKKLCEVTEQSDYLQNVNSFLDDIRKHKFDTEATEIIDTAEQFILEHKNLIGKYCCSLMHDDFAPHNFRLHKNELYMLDFNSIHFGNPYETWARLINYMVVHNPDLETKLLAYIKSERSSQEYTCLRVMRLYKALFLLRYYTRVATSAEGDLRELAEVRIRLWIQIIAAILRDERLNPQYRKSYIRTRNTLRSTEERERQKDFNKTQEEV